MNLNPHPWKAKGAEPSKKPNANPSQENPRAHTQKRRVGHPGWKAGQGWLFYTDGCRVDRGCAGLWLYVLVRNLMGDTGLAGL